MNDIQKSLYVYKVFGLMSHEAYLYLKLKRKGGSRIGDQKNNVVTEQEGSKENVVSLRERENSG